MAQQTQRMILDAPWYVQNNQIRRDVKMTSVKEEIRRYSNQYSARLSTHPNDQIRINPHGDTRQQAFAKTRA
jgi:hypothetical protein